MENLKKPVEFFGRVLGLVIGEKFTPPAWETLEKYPFLLFW